MNATNRNLRKKLTGQIREIACETFEITCYMFPLEEWEIGETTGSVATEREIASVARFDGAANGALVIYPCPNLLDAIAVNMLGTDEATVEEKEGALCEIANIICGNTVPLFAQDEEICYIRPPEIWKRNGDAHFLFRDMEKQSVSVFLDEGTADIDVYYQIGGGR